MGSKLKILSVSICCLVIGLCSEPTKCQDFKQELERCVTLNNFSDLLSDVQGEEEKVEALSKEFYTRNFNDSEKIEFYASLRNLKDAEDPISLACWQHIVVPGGDAEKLDFVEGLLEYPVLKQEARGIFALIDHKNLTGDSDADEKYADLSKNYFTP